MREKTSFCSEKWHGWFICFSACLLRRECGCVGMLEVCQLACTIVCLTKYLFLRSRMLFCTVIHTLPALVLGPRPPGAQGKSRFLTTFMSVLMCEFTGRGHCD
jgi:hypothetical protein